MLTRAGTLAEMFGDEDESGLLRRTWRFLHEQAYINTGVLHDDPSQHAREGAVLSLRKHGSSDCSFEWQQLRKHCLHMH